MRLGYTLHSASYFYIQFLYFAPFIIKPDWICSILAAQSTIVYKDIRVDNGAQEIEENSSFFLSSDSWSMIKNW